MVVLEMLATVDNGTLRFELLLLVLVAVVLILAGGIIALLTLHSKRKTRNSRIESPYIESERT